MLKFETKISNERKKKEANMKKGKSRTHQSV